MTKTSGREGRQPRLQDFTGKEKTVGSYALSYFKLNLFAKAPMATPNVEADLIKEAWTHACKVNNYKKKLSNNMHCAVSPLTFHSCILTH